jgi:hypothetical protein
MYTFLTPAPARRPVSERELRCFLVLSEASTLLGGPGNIWPLHDRQTGSYYLSDLPDGVPSSGATKVFEVVGAERSCLTGRLGA